VPENLRTAMKMHFVDTMDQVLSVALEGPLPEPMAQVDEGGRTIAPPITPPAEGPTAHQ
jgi:ATP-dependent Lon protease